jgi:hypothetical protein
MTTVVLALEEEKCLLAGLLSLGLVAVAVV